MDCWKILELSPTSDAREIKRAYARLAKKYHPEDAPEEFRALHDAYEQALAYARRHPAPHTADEQGCAPNGSETIAAKGAPCSAPGQNSTAPPAAPAPEQNTKNAFDFSLTEEKDVRRQADRAADFTLGYTPEERQKQSAAPTSSTPKTDFSALMREQERRVRIAKLLVQFDLLYLDPKRRSARAQWQKLIQEAKTRGLTSDALFFPCLAEFLDVRRDIPRKIWILFDQLIPVRQLAGMQDRGVYTSIYRVLDSRFCPLSRREKVQRARRNALWILAIGVPLGRLHFGFFLAALILMAVLGIVLAVSIAADIVRERRSAQRGPVPRTPAMMKCRLGIRVAAISYLAVLALSASGLPQALFSPAVGSAVFSVLVALLFAAFASLAALWITLYIREWRRISAAARKEP